jgi:hypothetical protein
MVPETLTAAELHNLRMNRLQVICLRLPEDAREGLRETLVNFMDRLVRYDADHDPVARERKMLDGLNRFFPEPAEN